MARVVDIRSAARRFRELAESAAASAPTREQAEAAARADAAGELARLREERLDPAREFSAGAVILPADRAAIVRGTLRETHALRMVRAWHALYREAIGPGPRRAWPAFLTLYGPRGRGKTLAGAWLLATEGGLYVSADELVRRASSTHWRDTEWVARVLAARVVVLDDVGTEGADARAPMFDFVNRRQGLARALTLITSNLAGRADFVGRYDDRVVERLEHAGRMVAVQGDDLRGGRR